MDPKAPEAEGQEASQPVDDGTVEVHQASIEDLDAEIARLTAIEEQEGVSEEPAEVEPVASDNDPQTPTGEPEPTAQAVEPRVAPEGAEPSKPRVFTQEEIQGILADNERLKKEGNQKELFIQHRGNELGRLKAELSTNRNRLTELRNQLSSGLGDKFSEDPVQASNDRDQIKELDSQIEAINQQEERAHRVVEAQTFFLRHVDTEAVSPDDIADMLREEKMDERYIAQFKANMWEFTTPEALVEMGKRAAIRKNYITADQDRRLLAKHVLHLNEQLKKQRARPGQVLKQVQTNLNRPPPVTSATSTAPRTQANVDPTRMTTAQLDAALKDAMRQ